MTDNIAVVEAKLQVVPSYLEAKNRIEVRLTKIVDAIYHMM